MRTPGQRLAYYHTRHARRRLAGRTALWSFTGLAAIALAVVAVGLPVLAAFVISAYAASSLQELSVPEHAATFQTSRIYDRNGKLLYEFVDPRAGMRTVVPLAQVPESLRDATIAIEDRNFYTNPGFDLTGIARAAYDDLAHHRIVAGGSTITQQLVKTIYLSPQVTFQRKVEELLLSYSLTHEKSKDQILEMYLNQIYYGNQAYGIEAAAETYFDKTAIHLDLAESALLAGLPQSPTDYDPIHHFHAAKARQQEVLLAMVRQGYITRQQAADAYHEPLKFASQTEDILAPHFVFYVRDLLEKKYGARFLYEGGLTIRTTLDLKLQDKAQQIVQQELDKLPPAKNVHDAALVAIDPRTGQILAMVGSRDYNQQLPDGTMDGKFNAAVAPLQPGSTFKPFAYVTDFMKGRTPGTMVHDAPMAFPLGYGQYYRPQNYDRRFHGWITLRTALANSLNIPAVQVLRDAGIPQTLHTAHALGITTIGHENQAGLSLVLGGNEVSLLDMTSAYGVFADQGRRVPSTAILSITDSSGKVIEQYRQPQGQQVLDPGYAYEVTSILSDDHARAMEFGSHSVLQLDRPAAAKTGTTDDFRANWTIGYTPNLVVGVWAGNSNHAPMRNIIGIDGAGPIWHDFMEYALDSAPPAPFPRPADVRMMRMPWGQGMPPSRQTPYYHEAIVAGRQRAGSSWIGGPPLVRPASTRSTAPVRSAADSPAPSAVPAAPIPAAPSSPAPPGQPAPKMPPAAVPALQAGVTSAVRGRPG